MQIWSELYMNLNEKMWASILYGVDDLRYEQVEIPGLKPGEALVKVTACGICGSDIPRVLKTGTYHFPTIPGHEFGGIVVKTGNSKDEGLIDRRVACIPLIPCYCCEQCEVGNYAQCPNYGYLGSRNDGGFAQYCKVPVNNLVLIPDKITDDEAAMLEPITVAQHVVKNTRIDFGDDVIVYGLGAIGIFVAQWAKALGANHVFSLDLDEKKVLVAKSMGLDAICTKNIDAKDIILKRTNGRGADVAFEAAGSGYVFNEAVSLLKQNGKLGLVGRPPGSLEILNETYEKLLRNQITVKGTWAFEMKQYPHNAWNDSLQAICEGKINIDPVISHRLPLSKAYEGIRIMADHTEPFHKIIVYPNRF